MKKDKYKGADYRFVICDICGGKFRVYETVQIDDRYSTQNRMIVCKKDADKINPQIYPIYLKDDLLEQKDYVRPEPGYLAIANPNSNQLPSAPQNLRLEGDPLGSYILLTWDGPANVGSSPIIGYQITRADPMYSYQIIINANTGSAATSYTDLTSLPLSVQYSYQVAAVSELGVGPASNLAFWPGDNYDLRYLDFLCCDNGDTLLTDSGDYFIR